MSRQYKHGDIVELEGPNGERVVLVADENAPSSLTERLAQAEREKAALSVDINRRDHEYSKLEREREEWQAKYEGHGVWAAMSPDTMERVLKERTAERDAALAKVDELTRKHQHSEAGRMAAVGRAEAAEKDVKILHRMVDDLRADTELTDLEDRIEALAVAWEREPGHYVANQIRALLQPTKPESALDVLSRIEDIVARSGMGENSYTEPLAKLRKLLEEQK